MSLPLTQPSALRALLKGEGKRLRKQWGQNFMVNPHVVQQLVRAAGIRPPDVVIEIGPGLGVLTQQLLLECRSVIAVEVDLTLSRLLKSHLEPDLLHKLVLIEKDFLSLDLNEIWNEAKKRLGPRGHVRLVANLPYSITSPVIARVLEAELPLESMTVTVQKEVAERLAARPGGKEIGALTYLVQYYAHAEIAGKISPEAFFPRPKVDSAILHIELYSEPPVAVNDKKLFFQLVRTSFSQRRKMLRKTLRLLPFTKEKLNQAFERSGVDPQRRPETLSLKEFAALANALKEEP